MTTYTPWQDGRRPGAPYDRCSPNLLLIRDYLLKVWQGQTLGCYDRRPVRGGTRWSSHAFGAALDWGYGRRHGGPGREWAADVVIPFLINNAQALGIQRIHDYEARRYWQAGRGWINRPPGNGGDWLHIETSADAWNNTTPLAQRGLNGGLEDRPRYPGRPLKQGSRGKAVEAIQRRLDATADGIFGPKTRIAVERFQQTHRLEVDGIVGPKTWASLFPD